MQEQEITNTEKFGSLWNRSKPRFIGKCTFRLCKNKDIYDCYEHYEDGCGNLFCSKEHAELFHGIRPIN